jgi:hypothetical protein
MITIQDFGGASTRKVQAEAKNKAPMSAVAIRKLADALASGCEHAKRRYDATSNGNRKAVEALLLAQ